VAAVSLVALLPAGAGGGHHVASGREAHLYEILVSEKTLFVHFAVQRFIEVADA